MEGPHWVFMVCLGSTIKDQVIHQTRSKNGEKGANFGSSSDHDDFIDNAGRSKHWSL